ncbi:hypothetical protein [Candidatus Nitrospira bockiana]
MSRKLLLLMLAWACMVSANSSASAQEQDLTRPPVTLQQGECKKPTAGPELGLADLFMQLVDAYNNQNAQFIYDHAQGDAILYRFEGYVKDPDRHPNVRNGVFIGMKDYNNELEWKVLFEDYRVIKNAVSPCFRHITVSSDGRTAALLADYYFQYTEKLPPKPRRDVAEIRASVFFNCETGICKIANGSFIRTDVIGGEKAKKK